MSPIEPTSESFPRGQEQPAGLEGLNTGMRCRVREIGGITNFCECLTANGATCAHALSFGYCQLCHHPEWKKFAR